MNRKLHNTLSALTFSAASLVLGLMAATPTLQPTPAGVLAVAEAAAPFSDVAGHPSRLFAASTTVATLAGPVPTSAALASAPDLLRRKSGKTSRIRQSMAVPFFSFAPRG